MTNTTRLYCCYPPALLQHPGVSIPGVCLTCSAIDAASIPPVLHVQALQACAPFSCNRMQTRYKGSHSARSAAHLGGPPPPRRHFADAALAIAAAAVFGERLDHADEPLGLLRAGLLRLLRLLRLLLLLLLLLVLLMCGILLPLLLRAECRSVPKRQGYPARRHPPCYLAIPNATDAPGHRSTGWSAAREAFLMRFLGNCVVDT